MNAILRAKYDVTYEHESSSSSDFKHGINVRQILERKFRLTWNFSWHGGSLFSLCNDLINNPKTIDASGSNSFDQRLCLNETDKFLIRFSSPLFVLKQLSDELLKCSTHQDALCLLDLLQIVVTIIDGHREFDLGIDQSTGVLNEWHVALNRFTAVLPSVTSRSDQLLFSRSFHTIFKILKLESNQFDKRIASSVAIDQWLLGTVYNPNNAFILMIKQFLNNYESDELRIK